MDGEVLMTFVHKAVGDVGSLLAGSMEEDGTVPLVEPMAGDRVDDNLNAVGAAYYGLSTLLCTPNTLAQERQMVLGAQPGEARLRSVAQAAGFEVPPRGGDAFQHRL